MSVIEASSVKVATMADGTLRITCDIEPMNAQAAFALFGSPGTPMALAALKVGHAAITSESAAEVKPKGGPLAKLAGMWCGEERFQNWICSEYPLIVPSGWGTTDTELVAAILRIVCDVDSRAEFDNDPAAEARFHREIRGPYSKYLSSIATTA